MLRCQDVTLLIGLWTTAVPSSTVAIIYRQRHYRCKLSCISIMLFASRCIQHFTRLQICNKVQIILAAAFGLRTAAILCSLGESKGPGHNQCAQVVR